MGKKIYKIAPIISGIITVIGALLIKAYAESRESLFNDGTFSTLEKLEGLINLEIEQSLIQNLKELYKILFSVGAALVVFGVVLVVLTRIRGGEG